MNLPSAPTLYDPSNERQTRATLEREDARNFKKGEEIRLARGERLILKSADGTEWAIGVTNAGVLSLTPA